MIGKNLLNKLEDAELMVALEDNKEVCTSTIKELVEAGKIKPVMDKRYSLSEVPEAIRYLEEGHARGKIVITM